MTDPTADQSDHRERADVALLHQTWGMDEDVARELLRGASMNVELAVEAWIEAGEEIAQGRVAGAAIPAAERLAVAVKHAQDRLKR
jgi:hypothetical protein